MTIQKDTHIAIVGVSNNSEKYGYKIFTDLLKNGYTVTGVNPKGGTVVKKRLVASLSETQPKPELVIIVGPPANALSILKECRTLGIKNVWMQPGAESDEARTFASENQIELTTNACFMVREKIW